MEENSQITIFDASPDTQNHEFKLSADELQNELLKFNLTANQAKVYIFLGKYGSKTAPEVCKALKIARTETYHLLSTLQSKGVVSASFEHPIKFSALPVQKAMKTLVNAEKERVKTLEKQEGQISKLWEKIPEFSGTGSPSSENKFQMLQGQNPINGKLGEMISSAKKEILVLGSEKDNLRLYHSDFLVEMSKGKSNTKILTNCSEKTQYVFNDIKNGEVRKFSKSIKDELFFIIKDDAEMIFFTKNNQYASNDVMAMWTDSSPMIYSMKLLFESIWSGSKAIQ